MAEERERRQQSLAAATEEHIETIVSIFLHGLQPQPAHVVSGEERG
jgi:hypothetical protein